MKLPNVCIIGGGSSGMVACKLFQDENIPFDCYETGDKLGGNWVFKNKNKMSAAYKSLHINTSKKQMEFKCFPMPESYPDFPHHSEVLEYFDKFVERFKLNERVTFNTSVVEAERQTNGSWKVRLSNGQTKTYDAVVVANGHHWDPHYPDPGFDGEFTGETMHSHHYIDPLDPLDTKGKNVCIVGMGNSAMDIACELGNRGNANKVFLSVRRGTHIVPKYMGGKPMDLFLRHPGEKPKFYEHPIPAKLFERVGFWYMHQKVKSIVGEPNDFGLPKPKHRFGQTHPTISDEIHIRLGSGDVLPKPNIRKLDGKQIVFEDGSREDVDILIYATGYKISFPFFKKPYMKSEDNEVPLFKRMVHPEYHNLLFLGLIQPLCSIMPIAEVQSRWMAKYLSGAYALPSQEEMNRSTIAEYNEMKSRYVASKRHTIQINCQEYTLDLDKEIKRGFQRAKRENFQIPEFLRPTAVPTAANEGLEGKSQYA